MKLFRFGNPGAEKPGIITTDGKMIDVSSFGEDFGEFFFTTGGLKRLGSWLKGNSLGCPEIPSGARFGSCVARPSKIVAIGLNYRLHIQETGAVPPKEPIIFMKATTALCGPNDHVIIPENSQKTDWEVELAVIIGKKAFHVSEGEALNYVAGYTIINDYSEREFQLERGGQWTKGKSADSFAPAGPYLVTPDEIPDPQNLRLWLKVNDEIYQDSNTRDMLFKIPVLISYVSRMMTLLPGDILATGTPSGVGMGMKPPRFLKPGDRVDSGIEGLGTQQQTAVSYSFKQGIKD